MNRFEDLQAFVAVVEAGSFTAAAERIGLAKSAISRRVSALEERLGAQLLRRTTRQLSLTDAGKGLYERGLRILADLDEAENAAAAEHGELRGDLKIALPLSFGNRHMRDPISEFHRRHPNIRFNLDLNDRYIDLIEQGADLAIRIGQLKDSSLIARRLFESRSIVCASPAYLEAHGEPQTPDDLKNHGCLTYHNLVDPRRWRYKDRNKDEQQVDVNVAMTSSSGDFLCTMAVEGVGIVLQPTFIVGTAVSRGELKPILQDYEWPTTTAYAVYPPTRRLSSRVRAFIDFIAQRFEGTLYWDSDCLETPSNGDPRV